MRISSIRSSTCPFVGRICTSGSTRPVGRTICSTTFDEWRSSYALGVADMYTVWCTRSVNSSNFSGRLSIALGRRNPCSTSTDLRERSPSYMPPIWGTVTCDSSITTR